MALPQDQQQEMYEPQYPSMDQLNAMAYPEAYGINYEQA
jgi:hypothetical protein